MLQYRFMQLLPLFSFLFQMFIFSYLSFQIRFRTMLWSSKNNHTGILVGIGLNFSIHFSRIDICVILSPSRQEQDTHLFFHMNLHTSYWICSQYFIFCSYCCLCQQIPYFHHTGYCYYVRKLLICVYLFCNYTLYQAVLLFTIVFPLIIFVFPDRWK